MTKIHDLKTVIVNHIPINYFYTRERNDVNGNPRFRAYIMDPEAPAVYETVFKTYEGLLPGAIKNYIERARQ